MYRIQYSGVWVICLYNPCLEGEGLIYTQVGYNNLCSSIMLYLYVIDNEYP